jgi:hypothetical protein
MILLFMASSYLNSQMTFDVIDNNLLLGKEKLHCIILAQT